MRTFSDAIDSSFEVTLATCVIFLSKYSAVAGSTAIPDPIAAIKIPTTYAVDKK